MQYRITIILNNTQVDPAELDINNISYLESYHANFSNEVSFYLYSLTSPFLTILAITTHSFDKTQSINNAVQNYLTFVPQSYNKIDILPILYSEYSRLIDRITEFAKPEDNNTYFLVDDFELDKHLVPFEIGKFQFKDVFAQDKSNKIKREMLNNFNNEKNHILSIPKQRFIGHPAHYHITCETFEDAEILTHSLITILASQDRLLNTRLVTITNNARFRTSEDIEIDLGCHMASGGSILFDLSNGFDTYEPVKLNKLMSKLAQSIFSFQHEALFFFYTSSINPTIFELLEQHLNFNIVTFQAETLSKQESQTYLTTSFQELNLDITRIPFLLSNYDEHLTYSQLTQIINYETLNSLVCSNFNSYGSPVNITSSTTKSEPLIGQSELKQLVGLQTVKLKINEIVRSSKAMKHYNSTFKSEPFSNHMVFSGNPGTAKTTVARIIGKIFKENNLLSVGRFYELSRADLIERYVGWTAKHIQDVFKQAKGSVLFIDEAYSLMDKTLKGYGDEAISTILQEMENNRNDIIVIFAGYPKQMKEFIQSNPGLKSRIKHFIEFEDYSLTELLQIAKQMVRSNNMELNQDGLYVLSKHLLKCLKEPDFGNARDVRNLIEQAITIHLSQLPLREDSILNPDECTLSDDDFYFIQESKNSSHLYFN